MLERCLDALAAQSRLADEVIVVDNGSTDHTSAVGRAARARVVVEPSRGVFPATAAGFDAASGSILARLDADSVPPADWLERIHRAFKADGSLDAITGPGDFYGSNSLVHWIAEHLYIGGYNWFIGWVLGHPPVFGSNYAIRADVWLRLRDTVHRDFRDVHDDLDLSFHIEPGMSVRWNDSLRVGVSARPFSTLSGLGRRLALAYTTIRLHWRDQTPFQRRAAHREARYRQPGPKAAKN
jgi:glycosyltransferase involved in cell wall biosynthesis